LSTTSLIPTILFSIVVLTNVVEDVFLIVMQITNFINEFNHRPISKKGYTLGARTATRFREYVDVRDICVISSVFGLCSLGSECRMLAADSKFALS